MDTTLAWRKLELAHELMIQHYGESLQEIIWDKNRPVIKFHFPNEVILYIRYNDYGEYTYLIIFSPEPNDQIRFDNYDDFWEVKTKPHHYHLRGLET